jgi:hypothetical protein
VVFTLDALHSLFLLLFLSFAVSISFFLFSTFICSPALFLLNSKLESPGQSCVKIEGLTRYFGGGRNLRHVREKGGESGEEMVQAKRLLEAVGKLSVRAATIQREKAHNFHQLFATNRAKRNNSKSNNSNRHDSNSPDRQDVPRNIDDEGLASQLAYSVVAGLAHWSHMSYQHSQQVGVVLSPFSKIKTSSLIEFHSNPKSCSTPFKIETWVFRNPSAFNPKILWNRNIPNPRF